MATVNVAMVPLEEYLRTSYHPDCDWVDGELKERNVGEEQHASVQGFLTAVLRINGKAWGIRTYPEFRVQTSARHYRVADVCVVLQSTRFEGIARTPPLLCIEVLSKDDRMSEMQEKIEDYLGMGVSTVWVIDPQRRKAFNSDVAGLSLPVTDFLTVKGTSIHVSIEAMFEELNELEAL